MADTSHIVGGGPKKVLYTLATIARMGVGKASKALTAKNACKACAYGMGGQRGGMTNELNEFPSVCNKSVQAQSTDIQPAIPHAIFEHRLDDLQELTGREMEHLGRLGTPLFKRAGADRYEPVDWDFALGHAVERMKATDPRRSFFYSSGRSSNEAGFIFQLLARAYGTNNVNNCSYYCHQATSEGLATTIGKATASVELEDLTGADLIFVTPGCQYPTGARLSAPRRKALETLIHTPLALLYARLFLHPDVVRQLRQHPDPFTLPECSGRVIPQPAIRDDGIFTPHEAFGLKAMSIGSMLTRDQAVVWRGPMATSALRQLLRETDWGTLDILVIDLPPGTGDIHISLFQQAEIDGVVIVSTPQDLALIDAKKAIDMLPRFGVPILGLVENMSYFIAPDTGTRYDIFGSGGAERAAADLGIAFLGAIPLVMSIREGSDAGRPPMVTDPAGAEAAAYRAISSRMISGLSASPQ